METQIDTLQNNAADIDTPEVEAEKTVLIGSVKYTRAQLLALLLHHSLMSRLYQKAAHSSELEF